MLNLLFEDFPDAVEVSGKFYKIVTDFRDWIAFYDMMSDEKIPEKQRILTALQWFAEEIPENLTGAFEALLRFASCDGIHYAMGGESAEKSEKTPTFSWLYDSVYILGAFRQVYNIDLIREKYLHWWEFSALFEALPEDVPLKKRIAYRQVKINDVKDKNKKREIIRIKRAVAFPHKPVSAQKTGEIFAL
ncbi:MAG: bacteriophage Gp15 family protein [Ruminococcus sp.]|nr:bacteriophage Gp15 family protein [Ruminococcus sp.]